MEQGVWLLVSKGNLRHRIAKLGAELDDSKLSDVQQKLRSVARAQNYGSDTPERPGWANGAFLYLAPHHAIKIHDIVKQYGLRLQSKHVLVSEEVLPLVKKALSEGPEGPGREAFLMRRAGFIEKQVLTPLVTDRPILRVHVKHLEGRYKLAGSGGAGQDCEFAGAWKQLIEIAQPEPAQPEWADGAFVFLAKEDIEEARAAVMEHHVELGRGVVLVSCQFRTMVERALGLNGVQPQEVSAEDYLKQRAEVIEEEYALPFARKSLSLDAPVLCSEVADDSAQDDDASEDVPTTNWLLLQLSNAVMTAKDIDPDLAEYLVSPLSVQEMAPEVWLNAWEHICVENHWLEMRDGGKPAGIKNCPYDTLSSRWASMPHLMSDSFQKKVQACGHRVGPVLTAVLEARQLEKGRNTGSAGSPHFATSKGATTNTTLGYP